MMKYLHIGLIVALIVGMAVTGAESASTNVIVVCNTVSYNGSSYVYSCNQAPTDTSGLQVQMTITSPTQRYALNTNATMVFP